MIGLEYARIQNDMSMEKLGKELGVSKQLVSMWVNGIKNIPDKRLYSLEEILGVEGDLLRKEITDEDKIFIERRATVNRIKRLEKEIEKLRKENMSYEESMC